MKFVFKGKRNPLSKETWKEENAEASILYRTEASAKRM